MKTIRLAESDYLNRMRGCWMGKNIGGTIGEPFEWKRQQNNVTFYSQELKGRAAPNDDLDIQLLWLIALEERGVDIDAHILAHYWFTYLSPFWCEYGRAKINLGSGLPPPLSGSFANDYKDSCGAFIRSEIWACLAPGMPDLAAWYAFQDAILDHGDGEGTYAEVFCAAMESAAFVVRDLREAIEIGLSYIPADCGITAAVRTGIELGAAKRSVTEARDIILDRHRGAAWTPGIMSQADLAKGFATGKAGYDAPSNIAITIYALVAGGDDFGQVQCLAVNCGEDTDCTAATAGSVWGILHGYDAIPKKWIEPIGDDIVTVCLNKGDLGHFGANIPQTVTELTRRTLAMTRAMLPAKAKGRIVLDAGPTDLSGVDVKVLRSANASAGLFQTVHGPVFRFPFYTVEVNYDGDPVIVTGQEKKLIITIRNTYKPQANLGLSWHLPENCTVTPAGQGFAPINVGVFGKPIQLIFGLTSGRIHGNILRATLEISVDGRATVMHVPVTLLNGNFLASAPLAPRGT